MPDNSFLDKGIILGYCFLLDPHHHVCSDYIHSNDLEYYATEIVQNIYRTKKDELISRQRAGILGHVRRIEMNYGEVLSEDDIEDIVENIDRYNNDAWRYLEDYYEGLSDIRKYTVTEDLRDAVQDIETLADDRKDELFSIMMSWIRFNSYPDLHTEFDDLKREDEEDFYVLLDAHDLGAATNGRTELATPNPADFASGDIRERILERTGIDEVRIVAVSRTSAR